jgi:hypothetical protein
VTCASYSVEHTAAAEADQRSLSGAQLAELETHVATLSRAPLPAATNRIRRHRGQLTEPLPPGWEGPFWAQPDALLVLHAVHRKECRVVLLWIVPPTTLRLPPTP